MREPASRRSGDVQAALGLAAARPAAGARILAAAGRARARRAADRRETAIVQLVVRDAVLVDVAPAVALAPVDERLHLHDSAACVEHELRSAGALLGLVAADAGQPAVGVADRALERLDLAQAATAVGLALPQPGAVRIR